MIITIPSKTSLILLVLGFWCEALTNVSKRKTHRIIGKVGIRLVRTLQYTPPECTLGLSALSAFYKTQLRAHSPKPPSFLTKWWIVWRFSCCLVASCWTDRMRCRFRRSWCIDFPMKRRRGGFRRVETCQLLIRGRRRTASSTWSCFWVTIGNGKTREWSYRVIITLRGINCCFLLKEVKLISSEISFTGEWNSSALFGSQEEQKKKKRNF